jgi:hypothetical protein
MVTGCAIMKTALKTTRDTLVLASASDAPPHPPNPLNY